MPPKKHGKISQIPYEEIVEALNSITIKLEYIGNELRLNNNTTNLQTKYLEVIGRKINKKGFKKYFGKMKKKCIIHK